MRRASRLQRTTRSGCLGQHSASSRFATTVGALPPGSGAHAAAPVVVACGHAAAVAWSPGAVKPKSRTLVLPAPLEGRGRLRLDREQDEPGFTGLRASRAVLGEVDESHSLSPPSTAARKLAGALAADRLYSWDRGAVRVSIAVESANRW
jgi:hypothetical protein